MTENYSALTGVFSVNTSLLTNGQIMRFRDNNNMSATTNVKIVPTSGYINGLSSVTTNTNGFSYTYMYCKPFAGLIHI